MLPLIDAAIDAISPCGAMPTCRDFLFTRCLFRHIDAATPCYDYAAADDDAADVADAAADAQPLRRWRLLPI